MFAESRPIDILMLVIEALVLVLIAAEFGWMAWRHWKTHKRLESIFKAMDQGHKLLESEAPRTRDNTAIAKWEGQVDEWMSQTANLLQAYSPQAKTSFLNTEHRPQVTYEGVATKAQEKFGLLAVRINKVQAIMEKPEVYY